MISPLRVAPLLLPVLLYAAQPALDMAALEAYVRHLFIWNPEIKVAFSEPKPSGVAGLQELVVSAAGEGRSEQHRLLVADDGRAAILGTLFRLDQNPFQADLDRISLGSGPSLGSPEAPVVLVLYTDFQCPYCREQSLDLRRNLPRAYPTEVLLYVKDFPLEPIHPWARKAALAGRCIYRQGSSNYWSFHDWIFENQAAFTPQNIVERILDYAQTRPIDTLQLSRCLEDGSAEAEVDRSIAEARSLQIDSVPTLFINGRRINRQLSWAQIKTIIDNELYYQRATKKSGQAPCCVVQPASPLGE